MNEAPSQPLTQRLTAAHWAWIDLAAALFLAAASVLATVLGKRVAPAGADWATVRIVALLLACLPLPLRRRSPLLALSVMAPAEAVVLALSARGPSLIPVTCVLYSVAMLFPRAVSRKAAAALLVCVSVGALAAAGGPAWATLLSAPPIVLVGWLAGDNTRARRGYARAVAEQAMERERERAIRAERAVGDERLRIARDLHDIVAHAMSVIAVRSGVARVVLDSQPEQAREALGIIETTSKRALVEMRLMVGMLRQSEDSPALGPAPGLADLTALLDQAAQAGIDVTVDVRSVERADSLPDSVDLSAYRIIQEALTNVVRHAGPTTASVTVRQGFDRLDIEVVDDGPRGVRPAPSHDGAGHGLVGMRERVALFGGQLSAAPRGRGFRVAATLPFSASTR